MQNAQAEHRVPSLEEDAMPAARDVDSASTHSIEDAKVKAEEDAKRAAAEEEKMGVRELLSKLKTEYAALARENDARPFAERLPAAAFEVDPGLREVIEAETLAHLERATESLAWHCEKSQLGLRKLRERFLDDVETERAVVRSFATGRSAFAATSFRVEAERETGFGPGALKENGAPGRRRAGRGGRAASAAAPLSPPAARAAQHPPALGSRRARRREENPFAVGHKQELRRAGGWRARGGAVQRDQARRDVRKSGGRRGDRDELKGGTRSRATRTLSRREDSMNYGKKREQMLRLEARRATRAATSTRASRRCARRAAVVRQAVAAPRASPRSPPRSGTPRRRRARRRWRRSASPFRATRRRRIPDGNARRGDGEVPRSTPRGAAAAAAARRRPPRRAAGSARGRRTTRPPTRLPTRSAGRGNARTRRGGGDAPAAMAAESDDVLTGAAASSADETDSERAARTLRLRHERAALVRNRLELPARFDEALRALRRHKSFVEGELKAAENKQLTYNRELMSLKKFEDGEASLREKLSSRYAEQEDIEQKAHDVAAHMADTAAEPEVNERKQKVLNEFDKFVDEEHARPVPAQDFPAHQAPKGPGG